MSIVGESTKRKRVQQKGERYADFICRPEAVSGA